MHVVIFNGSPRVKQHSNTDKIISSFVKGMQRGGATYELYSLSDRREWEAAREAFMNNDKLLIALPLYVECVPGLLLEFLESLPTERQRPAELSFILQGGFDEGAQLRCGEAFLKSLATRLGCTYNGCLVKGGNFLIRFSMEDHVKKLLSAYEKMGESFVKYNNFMTNEARKFTGPEQYPLFVRLIVKAIYNFTIHKNFEKYAKEWGCKAPLDYKPLHL